MKLIGNILAIKNKREDKHKAIELHIESIEYVTSKKDGKYYQSFNFVDEPDTPIVITGDCLSLSTDKKLPENEYEFKVWDLVDGEYVLNENKYLSLLLYYDFEENITILSSIEYIVTLPAEEFDEFKSMREKEIAFQKGRNKKKK